MSNIKRGEVYWANLDPTIGSEISKKSPVLVISNDINNQFAATVTILPITSSSNKTYPFEVSIEAGEYGLSANSKIKANQIRTISIERLYQKVGSLSNSKMKEVENAILIHLGIK